MNPLEKDILKQDLMESLKGLYTLERQMICEKSQVEQSIDMPLHIKGEAFFCEEKEHELRYYERGSYVLNNICYDFFQERYFLFDHDQLKILNDKKTLLHQVSLACLVPPFYQFSNTHICGKDNYEVHFKIEDGIIHMNYRVLGPFKNYHLKNLLLKVLNK